MQKNNFKIKFNKKYFVYFERLIIKQMTNSILNHQWVVTELLVKGNQSLNLQLLVLLPPVFSIVLQLGLFLQTAWHTEINNQIYVDFRCQTQACFTTTKFQNTVLWRQTDMCNSIKKTETNLNDNKNVLPVMATDIPRIHKWWQQPSPNNDYRPPLPQP